MGVSALLLFVMGLDGYMIALFAGFVKGFWEIGGRDPQLFHTRSIGVTVMRMVHRSATPPLISMR